MVSQDCIDLIKKWEGLRLAPYLCSAGVPTIGYGSTFYEDGTRVTLADPAIDEERAEALLSHEVASTDVRVRLMAKNASDGQHGALVSFAYNVGTGALRASTLLRKHNAGDYAGAARQFANWKYAGGKASAGLIARRADEREMYEAT